MMANRLLFAPFVLRRSFSLSSAALNKKNDSQLVPTKGVADLKDPRTVLEADEMKRKELLRNSVIEVNEPMNISPIIGIPDEHIETRRVRIFKPSKNTMQSGTNNINLWVIQFECRERWENPLMGWTSSGDSLSNIDGWLRFKTKEDAMHFCEKNGWQYSVEEPEVTKRPIKKSYADNFSWNKRTRVGSK
ncbi:NADH dehydrogenase [ubiquinone] iron-sulfur protein 4-like protein [Dinothrombium tinctorium]|uniref:NADH dehydrogenase [ubiquinone] iron-sulfur protein 4, mitochondrial n=1 Tax=Dinothrombium tinctorium TaxID=1965070 RepID=A0A3S3PLW5_9ACAR|nr:NADH dehydrogenase [ubiquinone] iron-sulfur protein 4-like protein [Dinothrombium tinctorium]